MICEELGYSGQMSTTLQTHNDIIAPYIEMLGTPEQKRHWLPKMVTGEVIGAVAMTEPQAGSDLKAMQTRARRDGDAWVWKFDEEVTGQIGLLNYLGSQQLFRPRQQLDPKFREALRKLPGDMLEHDLVQRPLSVLGGKTLREAAADSAISRTAQAILLLLELQADALEIGRAHV
mgnify:CR=1 FL=1